MNREKVFRFIGYILVAYWIIFTFFQFRLGNFAATFWFCNIVVMVLAIACFEQSLPLLYFVLATGLFFETPWILDWVSYVFFDYSFFNLVQFYAGFPLYLLVLTFIRHTLTIPLAFVLLFLFEPKKPTKKVVMVLILIIFILLAISYSLDVYSNINCIYAPCIIAFQDEFHGFSYTIFWTFFVLIISLASLFFVIYPIHKIFWKIKTYFKKHKKR